MIHFPVYGIGLIFGWHLYFDEYSTNNCYTQKKCITVFKDGKKLLDSTKNIGHLILRIMIFWDLCLKWSIIQCILQGYNCVCIKDVGTMFRRSSVDPSNCNYNCADRTNNIYKTECGGESSFNVFEFISSKLYLYLIINNLILFFIEMLFFIEILLYW